MNFIYTYIHTYEHIYIYVDMYEINLKKITKYFTNIIFCDITLLS